MKLTKAEAALLLPIGVTEFAGTKDELAEQVTNAYYTWDDAPLGRAERQRAQTTLLNLADKMDFVIQ